MAGRSRKIAGMVPHDSKPAPTFDMEQAAFGNGMSPVAGVDEAGRGPWAGPVTAAAVILDPASIPDGLNDSKTLTPARRDRLFDEIAATSHVAIATATVERIDRDNILQASLWAMAEALAGLPHRPAFALIDGNKTPPTDIACTTAVKGDATSLSIAAASIVAKVTRDRLMQDLDAEFPGYGFARHKGYGTARHAAALARLGPCPAHRRSFAPVRTRLAQRAC